MLLLFHQLLHDRIDPPREHRIIQHTAGQVQPLHPRANRAVLGLLVMRPSCCCCCTTQVLNARALCGHGLAGATAAAAEADEASGAARGRGPCGAHAESQLVHWLPWSAPRRRKVSLGFAKDFCRPLHELHQLFAGQQVCEERVLFLCSPSPFRAFCGTKWIGALA